MVDAVLVAQSHNPAGAVRAVKQLSVYVAAPDWSTTLPAYARCVRITRDQAQVYPVDPAALADAAEQALYAALLKAESAVRSASSLDGCMQAFLPVIPAINHFFEAVMVMSYDPAVRSNRLGMLQRIAALPQGVADLSKLEGF